MDNLSNNMETPSAILSFGFSKRKEKSLVQKSSALSGGTVDGENETEGPDIITSVEEHKIKSVKPEKDKGELVIPLIRNNRWYFPCGDDKDASSPGKGKQQGEEDPRGKKAQPAPGKAAKLDSPAAASQAETLESRAISELIAESSQLNDGEEEGEGEEKVIPLLMQNKIPDGFETDDHMDVSLRPDEASETDYDSVPIEQYGAAMLRGMGWSPGQGVGAAGRNKCVTILEPVLRPKGLGLGASKAAAADLDDKSRKRKRKPGDKAEQTAETLTLGVNSYVRIVSGPHRDLYGQVVSVDGDNGRVIVKLSLSGQAVNVSEHSAEVVSAEHYNKYCKYINKGAVDSYYKDREAKQRQQRDEGGRTRGGGEERVRERGEEVRREDDARRKETSRKHKHESSVNGSERKSATGSSSSSKSWLYPNIRVRFIDEKYKRGKYYNMKVVIVDVTSYNECICSCNGSSNQLLYDIRSDQLETVIPKQDDHPTSSLVIVLNDKEYKHEICKIVGRDKQRCRASCQLLSDPDIIISKAYDDICEYVGPVNI